VFGEHQRNSLSNHVLGSGGRDILSLCFGVVSYMIRKDLVISGKKRLRQKRYYLWRNLKF